jgi:hypothetical protein
MDPNEALKNARNAYKTYLVASDKEDTSLMAMSAAHLVDAFEALDEWLMKGGFRPDAWERAHEERARVVKR